jgi:hypothetical protein
MSEPTTNTGSTLWENLQDVRRKIRSACQRAGRDPSDVTLIAVTKTFPVAAIAAAMQLGLKIFGESYIQEAFLKAAALPAIIPAVIHPATISAEAYSKTCSVIPAETDSKTPPATHAESRTEIHADIAASGISWHLIGHLQKNKAAQAVKFFDVIHSVDSAALASALDRHAGSIFKIQRLLIQVSLAGEETKYGIDESGLIGLVKAISGMQNLRLEGLMTIPPYNDDPEVLRPYFARMRRLRDEINAGGYGGCGYPLRELSMGMSGDFEAAIEEGSTMVRVGTGLFGTRFSR